MVAPVLNEYVDHELSANLDSTFAFEGPEKLLEIWVWPNDDNDVVESTTIVNNDIKLCGLRTIPFDQWVKILDVVNCKVLSMKSSKFMDSFLLSESSLFVFPHKLILKTCGTTTTLACIDLLFETIQKYINKKIKPSSIYKIFYSRRSFMFPDKQEGVHRNWKNEVGLLNEYFSNGKAYVVGNSASDDHWYLYTGGQLQNDPENVNTDYSIKDQTFEILMTDLNPEKAQQFVTCRTPGFESLVNNGIEVQDLGHEFGTKTMQLTDLDSVFTNDYNFNHLPSPKDSPVDSPSDDQMIMEDDNLKFVHDAFSFSPCGYSSNSISCNNGGYYYTLHITPESGWSYASFETNYPFGTSSSVSIVDVLIKILRIFEPGKLSITLISEEENEHLLSEELGQLIGCHETLKVLGYKKNEKILYDLNNNYKLLYLHFEKI